MAKKYYKKIKNQNYDKQLLDIADAAIAGRGDG
ncbi:MAG: cell envelope biogenesis protein OmpA, partial [Leptospiraceae bacterium]|nr:cell envelope biogenesis protein OmpA [Leptospiraceae bacterium]